MIVSWCRTVLAPVVLALTIALPALAADPITIGVIGPLSGPAANSGIAMKTAAQYVVQKVNKSGGLMVDGEKRKIELLFEDSQSQPAVGVAAATKLLTRDQVDILMGDMFHSSVTLAIMNLVPSFPDTFFMSGQPVSGKIAKRIADNPEKFRNFWKGMYNSEAYAGSIWQSVHALVEAGKLDPGDKRIAFVAQDDDFGRSVIDRVRAHFLDNGWKEVMFSAVPLGHADFYPQITRLKADPPDLLVSVFSVVNSGMALVKQLQEKQLDVVHVAAYYPLRPEFREGVPAAARNGLLWTPLFFDPVHNEKQAAFAESFSQAMDVNTNGDHALGVCVMGALVANIKQAQSVDVDPLIKAFETNAHECVLGRWVFDPKNHTPKFGPGGIQLPVAQIQNGESYVIWPDAFATSEYQKPTE